MSAPVISPDTTDPIGRVAAEGFSGLGRIIGQAVASTGLVLGLMVYFGWVRTGVVFAVFGISTSTLGLSVQDYALRSVSSTVRPLAVLLLGLILVRPAHRLVLAGVRRPGRAGRAVAPVLVGIGLAAVLAGLLGFVGIVDYTSEWPLVPLSLGLGTLVAAYGVGVAGARRPGSPGPLAPPPSFAVLQRIAVAGLLVVMLFWSAATFAQIDGTAEAERIAGRPTALPGAVVYTPHRLHLDLAGVTETALPPEAEPRYRYRYDGLRLLARSSGRSFLLPARWRPGEHAVVLDDDPTYRLEFFRGG